MMHPSADTAAVASHAMVHGVIRTGVSKALLLVSAILLALAGTIVGVRLWRRVLAKAFGIDDWLMLVGLVFFICTTICAIACGFLALGTPYHHHAGNPDHLFVILVQFFYALSTAPIRSSVAASLLPYTLHRRRYKRILLAIIALSCAASTATVLGVMTQKRPFSDLWRAQHCEIWLSWWNYTIAAASIVLDLVLACMPYVLLWAPAVEMQRLSRSPSPLGFRLDNPQQRRADRRRRRQKQAAVLLALGACACIATGVSLGFTIWYRHVEGLEGRAELTICYLAELSLGLIAGSLHVLRGWCRSWWSKGKGPMARRPGAKLTTLEILELRDARERERERGRSW